MNPIRANLRTDQDSKAQLYGVFRALKQSPRVQELRTQAPDWVSQRLEKAYTSWLLPALGICAQEWTDFLKGEAAAQKRVAEKFQLQAPMGLPPDAGAAEGMPPDGELQEWFPLSGRGRRELKNLAALEDGSCGPWLQDRLRKKAQDRFQRQSGISESTWRRFLDSAVYPTEKTVQQIAQGLHLTPEEAETFCGLVRKNSFAVRDPQPYQGEPDPPERQLHPMKTELRRRMEARPGGLGGKQQGEREFLEDWGITDTAWDTFRRSSAGEVTSQDTLLKFTIAFGMEPQEAEDFLALIGAVFAVDRDLAVLTCLTLSIRDIYRIYDALELLCRGSGRALYPALHG